MRQNIKETLSFSPTTIKRNSLPLSNKMFNTNTKNYNWILPSSSSKYKNLFSFNNFTDSKFSFKTPTKSYYEKQTNLFEEIFPSIKKPFTLPERKLLNTNYFSTEKKEINNKTNKQITKIHFLKNDNNDNKKTKVNFVKNHAQGFQNILNIDFFKHYYRIWLNQQNQSNNDKKININANINIKKNQKNNVINFNKQNNEKQIIKTRLFVLEQTKQDLLFFEELINIHTKFLDQPFHQNYMKTKKFDEIIKNVEEISPNKIKNEKIENLNTLKKQDKVKYSVFNMEKINKKKLIKEAKLWKNEDKFLKKIGKQIYLNGINNISKQEIEKMQEIIVERKAIINEIENKEKIEEFIFPLIKQNQIETNIINNVNNENIFKNIEENINENNEKYIENIEEDKKESKIIENSIKNIIGYETQIKENISKNIQYSQPEDHHINLLKESENNAQEKILLSNSNKKKINKKSKQIPKEIKRKITNKNNEKIETKNNKVNKSLSSLNESYSNLVSNPDNNDPISIEINSNNSIIENNFQSKNLVINDNNQNLPITNMSKKINFSEKEPNTIEKTQRTSITKKKSLSFSKMSLKDSQEIQISQNYQNEKTSLKLTETKIKNFKKLLDKELFKKNKTVSKTNKKENNESINSSISDSSDDDKSSKKSKKIRKTIIFSRKSNFLTNGNLISESSNTNSSNSKILDSSNDYPQKNTVRSSKIVFSQRLTLRDFNNNPELMQSLIIKKGQDIKKIIEEVRLKSEMQRKSMMENKGLENLDILKTNEEQNNNIINISNKNEFKSSFKDKLTAIQEKILEKDINLLSEKENIIKKNESNNFKKKKISPLTIKTKNSSLATIEENNILNSGTSFNKSGFTLKKQTNVSLKKITNDENNIIKPFIVEESKIEKKLNKNEFTNDKKNKINQKSLSLTLIKLDKNINKEKTVNNNTKIDKNDKNTNKINKKKSPIKKSKSPKISKKKTIKEKSKSPKKLLNNKVLKSKKKKNQKISNQNLSKIETKILEENNQNKNQLILPKNSEQKENKIEEKIINPTKLIQTKENPKITNEEIELNIKEELTPKKKKQKSNKIVTLSENFQIKTSDILNLISKNNLISAKQEKSKEIIESKINKTIGSKDIILNQKEINENKNIVKKNSLNNNNEKITLKFDSIKKNKRSDSFSVKPPIEKEYDLDKELNQMLHSLKDTDNMSLANSLSSKDLFLNKNEKRKINKTRVNSSFKSSKSPTNNNLNDTKDNNKMTSISSFSETPISKNLKKTQENFIKKFDIEDQKISKMNQKKEQIRKYINNLEENLENVIFSDINCDDRLKKFIIESEENKKNKNKINLKFSGQIRHPNQYSRNEYLKNNIKNSIESDNSEDDFEESSAKNKVSGDFLGEKLRKKAFKKQFKVFSLIRKLFDGKISNIKQTGIDNEDLTHSHSKIINKSLDFSIIDKTEISRIPDEKHKKIFFTQKKKSINNINNNTNTSNKKEKINSNYTKIKSTKSFYHKEDISHPLDEFFLNTKVPKRMKIKIAS